MALIQDVRPPQGWRTNKPVERVHRFHEATNVPDLVRPQPKPAARRRGWQRLLDFMQYPLIAGLAIGAAYSSTAGQVMVAGYAVLCLVLHLDSRYSFGAALLLLAGIPLFQLLNLTGVSHNCAIYTYELLVVGTLQAILETLRAE